MIIHIYYFLASFVVSVSVANTVVILHNMHTEELADLKSHFHFQF